MARAYINPVNSPAPIDLALRAQRLGTLHSAADRSIPLAIWAISGAKSQASTVSSEEKLLYASKGLRAIDSFSSPPTIDPCRRLMDVTRRPRVGQKRPARQQNWASAQDDMLLGFELCRRRFSVRKLSCQ
jgi:hypothetical protein